MAEYEAVIKQVYSGQDLEIPDDARKLTIETVESDRGGTYIRLAYLKKKGDSVR